MYVRDFVYLGARACACVCVRAYVYYICGLLILLLLLQKQHGATVRRRTSAAEHDNYRASHNKLMCTHGPPYARIGVPLAMPARFRARRLLHEPSRNFGTRWDLPDEMLNPETQATFTTAET